MPDGNLPNGNMPVDTEKKPTDLEGQVRLWQERVSIARQSLDQYAKASGAERYIDEYNGKFQIFLNGLKGQIPVPPINEIYAYVDADVSNTYNRDPHLSVNPKAGTPIGAKLWEAILNYYWRELKVKEEVEPEIIDKDLVGWGWHKVGYQVETDGAEEELKITKEGLISARIDWRDVVYNIGAKKAPYDCLWMAQRIVKPLSYVRKKYKNAKNLKGSPNPEIDKKVYDSATFRDDISIAVLWEIWDLETRAKYLIADGLNDKWLDEPAAWPDYLEEFPFLRYWDIYAPGKPHPMSAIAPWEAQVLEKMVILAQAVNHSKRWNRQILVKKGAISGPDLDKVERGDDGAVVEYNGTGELDKNMSKLDWGTLPVDFYLLMDRLAAIQRDVSGQPEFARGGVTKTTTRTEGELQMIQEGAKGRSDRKIDRFETHLENIARHMLMALKANFDFENAVRITGEVPEALIEALGDHFDPITGTVKFTAEEIAGEYDVEVKAGSTLPLNRQAKLQILDGILKTLASVQGAASPLLMTIIGEILDEFDMKTLEIAFQEELNRLDQEQQARSQELDGDEAKAKSQAVKNIASAQKITAEAENVRLQGEIDIENMVRGEPELALSGLEE